MKNLLNAPYLNFFLFIIGLGTLQSVLSQSDFEYKIDTTTLEIAPRFYVMDLTLKPLDNGRDVELHWKTSKNVRYFMVEIYNESDDELIYRQVHNHNRLIFPKEGKFAVAPLTKYSQGIPLCISLQEATERDFKPKNTSVYYEIKERSRQQALQIEKQQATLKLKQQEEQKQHDLVSSIVGISVFAVTAFFAIIIVLIIWLVNRKKSKVVMQPSYNKEFDQDFESKK